MGSVYPGRVPAVAAVKPSHMQVSPAALTLGEDVFLWDKQELLHKSPKLLLDQAAVGSLSRNIPQMLRLMLPRASSCI